VVLKNNSAKQSRDHCQKSKTLFISNTARKRFKTLFFPTLEHNFDSFDVSDSWHVIVSHKYQKDVLYQILQENVAKP